MSKASDLIQLIGEQNDFDIEDFTDDLASELEKAARFHVATESISDNEFRVYEIETKKGEGIEGDITVNPSNQPKPKPGKVKVGVYLTGDYESSIGTLEDGVWEFKITDGPKKIAKILAQVIQKRLDKF